MTSGIRGRMLYFNVLFIKILSISQCWNGSQYCRADLLILFQKTETMTTDVIKYNPETEVKNQPQKFLLWIDDQKMWDSQVNKYFVMAIID